MDFPLEVVEQLAPDQSSLNAAKKLLNPAKWPLRGQTASLDCIWGQCQGSGSNPYFTMANLADHGYKCTCPSRKFPCKHVLALMWQYAEGASDFGEASAPEWVSDWLARRRKTSAVASDDPTENNTTATKKNIHATADEEPALSEEEQIKKAAARARQAEKTKANTKASIGAGLMDFQQWIDDQLRTGIGNFIREVTERCRRMAARLVDAKASNLASRLDELAAKLKSLPGEQQAQVVFRELGQMALLCEAWLTDPEEPDAKRAVATAESREQVLGDDRAVRRHGVWENIGEQLVTRRDGLISHATWLLSLSETTPQFALLQDFYPASSGRRQVGVGIGSRLEGELAFYPSRSPLRALLVEHQILSPGDPKPWPQLPTSFWQGYQQYLTRIPWTEHYPYLLRNGRLLEDNKGRFWWQDAQAQHHLLLSNRQLPPLLLGCQLQSAFIVWDGNRGELVSAQTDLWGNIAC